MRCRTLAEEQLGSTVVLLLSNADTLSKNRLQDVMSTCLHSKCRTLVIFCMKQLLPLTQDVSVSVAGAFTKLQVCDVLCWWLSTTLLAVVVRFPSLF